MCVTLPSSVIWVSSLIVGVNLYQCVLKQAYNDGNRNDLLFNCTSSYQFLYSVLL